MSHMIIKTLHNLKMKSGGKIVILMNDYNLNSYKQLLRFIIKMSRSSLTSNNRLLHITDLPNSKKYS